MSLTYTNVESFISLGQRFPKLIVYSLLGVCSWRFAAVWLYDDVGIEYINEEKKMNKKIHFSLSITILVKIVALHFLLYICSFDFDFVKQIAFTEVFSFRLFSVFRFIHF